MASTALFAIAEAPQAWAACPAGEDCWTGATSTDWFVGTNWTTGTPDATTNVIINQGSPNANPSIGINATSNAAASALVEIATTTNSTGLVTLSTTNAQAASWTIHGTLVLGEAGNGTINVSNGASLVTQQQALIGDLANSTGKLTVDGAATVWDAQGNFGGGINSSPIIVGSDGNGTLTITNGATVKTTGTTGHVVIGFDPTGVGTVTVGSASSPGLTTSTLTNNGPAGFPGSLFIGYQGTGTLTVNKDGAVTGFSGATLGAQANSSGTVVVDGGVMDVSNSTGNLVVGEFGKGAMTVQAAAH